MERFSIVILSGGRSRRMGQDKANLIYEKETFLERIVRQMRCEAPLFFSVAQKNAFGAIAECTEVVDIYQECGPLGGIHASLSAIDTPWLFVTACDMPLMDCTFAEYLMQCKEPGTKAVIPLDENGRRHMMAGLYHKDVLPVIEEMLSTKNYKMRGLLEKIPVTYVRVKDFDQRRKLRNINDPEEYQKLLREDIPIIDFVGYANQGKSVLIRRLTETLTRKGIRIAYIKHTHHEMRGDPKGPDTEKVYAAGAMQSVLLGEDQVLWKDRGAYRIEEVIRHVHDVDLIILEGFKKEKYPKILVTQETELEKMPVLPEECRMIVGDNVEKDIHPVVFRRDEVEEIAGWICKYLEYNV